MSDIDPQDTFDRAESCIEIYAEAIGRKARPNASREILCALSTHTALMLESVRGGESAFDLFELIRNQNNEIMGVLEKYQFVLYGEEGVAPPLDASAIGDDRRPMPMHSFTEMSDPANQRIAAVVLEAEEVRG